jgi:16S rRNA (guanine1207-N2)-methyltransferase
MRKLFPKVTRRPEKDGVLYLATKTAPLKKIKRFDCPFAFRDQGRLYAVITRPGVFSHRQLDGGARALMNGMEIREGFWVLDIGCGSGVVGFAAAGRAPGVTVLAVDSNARAIEATQRGAAENGLTNISTLLNANGECGEGEGMFDIALGNPPYFSNYQIAHVFLQAARRALKPGGQVMIVTKTPLWYEEHVPEYFEDLSIEPGKNYTLIRAVQGAK